jgi:FkbM family methyltransferase
MFTQISTQLIVESRSLLDVEQVEVGGVPLWVRSDEPARHWDVAVAQPILAGDEYELAPLREAGHALRWVLDVGAHLGAFTLAIKRWWPEAQVVAAEPDPDSAALFRRNTEGMAGVAFEEAAVLGREGVAEVLLRQAGRVNYDGNAAASSVAGVPHPLPMAKRRPTAVVRAVSILDLLARHGDPVIDLLKLDCEGAEGEILEALHQAGRLARVRWIRGEWHALENLPRIEAALRDTHTFAIERGEKPWGSFLAHNHLRQLRQGGS